MKLKIVRYNNGHELRWNEFVPAARNGLFLFDRNYMDYHRERFTDHSLLILKEEKLIGIFPANEEGKNIYSHAGLTYGGIIFSRDLKAQDTLAALEQIMQYYRQQQFETLFYKAIPSIFHHYPCEEDLYALFRVNAILYRRDISSVIELSSPIRFSETKRQAIKKCSEAGLTVSENPDFSAFWELLSSVLEKFKTKPVHTLDEINYLKGKLPGKIKLFEARSNDELLAGVVIYDYGLVVHTQYMANSAAGRNIGALDFINSTLISEVFGSHKFYSFGTSSDDGGRLLNEGLIQQKEMMGGRAIVNDFYKITL